MNSLHPLSAETKTSSIADRAQAATQHAADELREKIPAKVGQAAAEIERLTRMSIDRAMNAAHSVKTRIDSAGERTVTYVRDEPVKSLLIAAASGAMLAGAISLWMRSRSRH